jgi:dihydrofolate reductase
MTRVTAQMSISLDGFYAGPKDESSKGPDGWTSSPEALGFYRITRWVTDAFAWRERQGFVGGEHDVSSKLVEESFASAGAYVMGRRMAEGGEIPWGEEPPFHAPVFVVTHRSRERLERKGGTSFTYVTDGLESAVAQAKAAASEVGKDVAVAGGGSLLIQVIEAGLLDQLDLHIVPVLLGDGMRLFDPARLALPYDEAIELTPVQTIQTPKVTHVRYTVAGRSKLVVDSRGREPDES